MDSKINSELTDLLADIFKVPSSNISLKTTRVDIGAWDSLKQMDLVVSLENKYRITLMVSDIVRMDSVFAILEILKSKGVKFES